MGSPNYPNTADFTLQNTHTHTGPGPEVLDITSQSLGSEETQALVRAMESGVKIVKLNKNVTLDIRDLDLCWTL